MSKTLKFAAILGAALLCVGTGAKADLINNGSFETTSGPGQVGFNTTVDGWTSSGYNFVFNGTSASSTGADGQYGNLTLWGPDSVGGTANGLGPSPDGGNFIAADGAFSVGPLSQTVSGLTAGQQYTVGFYWAGAQQFGYNGPTTEQWLVSLGGQQLATAVVTDDNHAFTGWTHTYLTFTADNSSEVLSFLAAGTPSGLPPFSLLDGVTMTPVPEPASMTIMGSGLAILGFIRRRKRR